MTDRIDTPRTPRALPTREQIADVIREVYTARDWMEDRHDFAADAVLTLIDKENTMNDDTTCTCFPVPQHLHTTHYSATDPATMLEPNPECPVHFPTVVADDTIPVSRALIAAAANHIHHGYQSTDMADVLSALLDPPKPPAPRLRVVDVDALGDYIENATPSAWGVYEHVAARPDVLTTVNQVIEEACGPTDIADVLKARIRAALEVAGD